MSRQEGFNLLRLLLNSWTCRGDYQEGKKEQALLYQNTQIVEGKFAFLEFVMEQEFFGIPNSLKIENYFHVIIASCSEGNILPILPRCLDMLNEEKNLLNVPTNPVGKVKFIM